MNNLTFHSAGIAVKAMSMPSFGRSLPARGAKVDLFSKCREAIYIRMPLGGLEKKSIGPVWVRPERLVTAQEPSLRPGQASL